MQSPPIPTSPTLGWSLDDVVDVKADIIVEELMSFGTVNNANTNNNNATDLLNTALSMVHMFKSEQTLDECLSQYKIFTKLVTLLTALLYLAKTQPERKRYEQDAQQSLDDAKKRLAEAKLKFEAAQQNYCKCKANNPFRHH